MLTEGLESDGGGGFFFSERCEIWIFSIIGAICVGLSGVFPLLVIPIESGPALKHGEPAKKLRLMLSFAVGSLLADVFLHLLPEVWARLDRSNHDSFTRSGLWVIFGLLGFMCIEKLFGESEEEESSEELCFTGSQDSNSTAAFNDRLSSISKTSSPNYLQKSSFSLSSSLSSSSKTKIEETSPSANGKHEIKSATNMPKRRNPSVAEPKIKITGYLNLLANIVDNFTHGLAVGCSFCVSTKVGVLTTFAILLHEIPHEVGDFAILLQSGFNKWKAAKAQVWTASGGVVGAVTALTVDTLDVTGAMGACILPFTAGGFLYIALVTVVPDLLEEKHTWESLKQTIFICLGILSIVIVTYAFD